MEWGCIKDVISMLWTFLFNEYQYEHIWNSQATLAEVDSADSLSSGQSVQWSGFTRSRSAAETLSTVGCVNSTGSPLLERTGHAAATAWLP